MISLGTGGGEAYESRWADLEGLLDRIAGSESRCRTNCYGNGEGRKKEKPDQWALDYKGRR